MPTSKTIYILLSDSIPHTPAYPSSYHSLLQALEKNVADTRQIKQNVLCAKCLLNFKGGPEILAKIK